MKKNVVSLTVFLTVLFFSGIGLANAAGKTVVITADIGANIRKGPGTNYDKIAARGKGSTFNLRNDTVVRDEGKNGSCDAGWYEISYNGSKAYLCASASEIRSAEVTSTYNRPWTSPKAAIIGGAMFITESYINKGQNTSYLKKFNVNPNSAYSVYNHQYMANLAAPYSEAYSSYRSYSENNLLSLPLVFTIPVFNNMPSKTTLPGRGDDTVCQTKILDSAFESKLNAEGFPKSYKCRLRALHKSHPNWVFKAMKTGLNFSDAIRAEKAVSSIQGGQQYYEMPIRSTEPGWYIANDGTVGFYLDPRNFLTEQRILMFEDLGYNSNYTTKVVQSILKGTFMAGRSELDNQTYASIFVEAGKKANISAVYLASLARQESGVNSGITTNGGEFTYEGTTYSGLYNFFNIGAYSSASNPALAGLVWASGGYTNVSTNNNGSVNKPEEKPIENNNNDIDENQVLNSLGVKIYDGHIIKGLVQGITVGDIKNKLNMYSVMVNDLADGNIIGTGRKLNVSKGSNKKIYTIAVSGDVDGDGEISAIDYMKIKNYIMQKSNLEAENKLASDVDGDGEVTAIDYVKIKNIIMGR